MDTFPSSPPAAVRADLATLRASLDSAGIPPKSLDRNVLIGTWNVRGFGKVLDKWDSAAGDSPRRNLRDILCLAEVVSRFDVVALQEVKRDLNAELVAAIRPVPQPASNLLNLRQSVLGLLAPQHVQRHQGESGAQRLEADRVRSAGELLLHGCLS